MKKLLAILGAITLTATASATVVACGTQIDTINGTWSHNSGEYRTTLTYDDLVSYLHYNTDIGIKKTGQGNINLKERQSLNNIFALYKTIIEHKDELWESLEIKDPEQKPSTLAEKPDEKSYATFTKKHFSQNVIDDLIKGFDKEQNILNKVNKNLEMDWTKDSTMEDFNNLDISLRINGALRPDDRIFALNTILSVDEWLTSQRDNFDKEEVTYFANYIWDNIFKPVSSLSFEMEFAIHKEEEIETKEETNKTEKFITTFNIEIESWRK